jgi:hypothetical protein
MGETMTDLAADAAVEAILQDELAREVRAVTAVSPVLRHLLATDAHPLVSEAVLARVRGMVFDLAAQLAAVIAGHDSATRLHGVTDPETHCLLTEGLLGDEAVLTLLHGLAIESLLAERFQQRHAIDPVLSPLLQELIASDDPAVASLAMNLLAAQSRFMQSQRRMELPLGELPAERFHALIAMAHRFVDSAAAAAALERLQHSYDEASSRLGLLSRLIAAMRRGVLAALALDHAGLALFASALAQATHQPRKAMVLACHEGQGARLALALRAAGLGPATIERQFMLIEPVAGMPRALAAVSAERADLLLRANGTAG